MGNYIADGFTIKGYIKGDPEGAYDACSFTFRRALAAARSRAMAREGVDYETHAAAVATEITKHLQSWDIRDDKGKAAPITVDVLLNRLPAELYYRLAEIVVWGKPSDDNPACTADEKVDANESEEAAAKN